MKRELRKIEEGFRNDELGDLNIVRLDGATLSAGSLSTEMMTVGFLSPKKLIIIENLLANKRTEQVEQILDLLKFDNPACDVVVIETAKLDKRTVAFKTLQKIAQSREFLPPDQFKLVQRINEMTATHGSTITKPAAVLLAAAVPNDSLRLEQEIIKLATYRSESEINESDIQEMVTSEVNSDVFLFIESLARRRLEKSLRALIKLIQSGQNENYILTMVVWQYRQLLIVRDLLDRKEATASKSGINPYVFGKVLSIAENYSLTQLRDIYLYLEEIDFQMKTGRQEPKLALELLAAGLCA